jgi:hypothetical protein
MAQTMASFQLRAGVRPAPCRAARAAGVVAGARRAVVVRAAAPREESAKAAVVGALVATLAGAPLMEASPAYAAVRWRGQPPPSSSAQGS